MVSKKAISVSLGIPGKPEDLTAAWLSDALWKGGYLPDGRVDSVSVELLDTPGSIFGTLVRLHLGRTGGSGELPKTMVAKLPSSNLDSARHLRSMGGDRAEICFYQQIRDSVGLRVPECFLSLLDETTGRFILLMEDLSPYRSPSTADGLTEIEIFAVVKSLAVSHAAWWQNLRLTELSWLPSLVIDAERFYSGFLTGWPILMERLGAGKPGLGALGQEIARKVRTAQDRLSYAPITFLHMDVRQENLFFAGDREDPIPIFIDWQIVRWGRGAASLASFLAFLPQRDHLEGELLASYHSELERAGIHDYSFDELFEDYRMAILRRFTGPTSVLASVDPDSPQGIGLLDLLSRFGLAKLERYL